jgi:fructose-1,6-bisphosphatase
LLKGIRLAAKMVYHEITKEGLVDIIGVSGDDNIQ